MGNERRIVKSCSDTLMWIGDFLFVHFVAAGQIYPVCRVRNSTLCIDSVDYNVGMAITNAAMGIEIANSTIGISMTKSTLGIEIASH